jgi:hypothetical protein
LLLEAVSRAGSERSGEETYLLTSSSSKLLVGVLGRIEDMVATEGPIQPEDATE